MAFERRKTKTSTRNRGRFAFLGAFFGRIHVLQHADQWSRVGRVFRVDGEFTAADELKTRLIDPLLNSLSEKGKVKR